jgi:hypothetical protein
VNAWAESAVAAPEKAATTPVTPGEAFHAAPVPTIAPIGHTLRDNRLLLDIAEIERARDALAILPVGSAKQRTRTFTLVPSRTTDPVPVVVGGVLVLVMLTAFGAAAAMSKFKR